MKLDLPTLAFILSLACLTQVVALLVQYLVSRTQRGTGWWLVGSALMALGFLLLSLGGLPLMAIPARIANPLLVAGRVCLYIGVMRFMGRQENRLWAGILFLLFLGTYYHFMFNHLSLVGRTIAVSAAIATFSLITASALLHKGKAPLTASTRFTAAIFLLNGAYLATLALYTVVAKPITSPVEYAPIQVAAFVVPIITSTLWTFGFILMMNQRLGLENEEERNNLQRIFNTSPDGALITRLDDGLVVDVNLGFLVMSGYTRAEAIGNSTLHMKVWHRPEDREAFLKLLQESGSCENREYVFERKNGEPFIGLVSANSITMNQAPHLISVVRDVTERKRVELALRESEETYRSILDASPDDITITDLEGHILMASPMASVMFGYAPGDEQGMKIQDFIMPEDVPRALENLRKMHQSSKQGTNEYEGVRKDGSTFEIEVNSGLIRGMDGRPTKMVFIVRDISARKRMEIEKAELEARNHQLQKAESLGLMAGSIAHHFNNKLQSVMANLELANNLPKGVDPVDYLAKAMLASEKAAEVSRLMLTYLGQSSLEREPRFLAELCLASLPHIQKALPSNVTLKTDCPAPGPIIVANADQIQQALASLMTNSLEAMGEAKGSLRLGLHACPAADIPSAHRFPIGWQPQGLDYACLEVADTGCGIADSDIDKVFDPFFSTKFTGRGLGLSVVLGIVQAHGGAITVESRQGEGSVFRIFVPVSTGAMPSLPDMAVEASKPESGGTILLVDDDEMLLMSTGALIETLGFIVLTAKDGFEAVEVFRKHQDDIRCVITDLTMPRMDGWETLAALRKLEPNVPVILASGYDKAQALSGHHADQPQAFLGKPFGRQQFLEALGQARGNGRSARLLPE